MKQKRSVLSHQQGGRIFSFLCWLFQGRDQDTATFNQSWKEGTRDTFVKHCRVSRRKGKKKNRRRINNSSAQLKGRRSRLQIPSLIFLMAPFVLASEVFKSRSVWKQRLMNTNPAWYQMIQWQSCRNNNNNDVRRHRIKCLLHIFLMRNEWRQEQGSIRNLNI